MLDLYFCFVTPLRDAGIAILSRARLRLSRDHVLELNHRTDLHTYEQVSTTNELYRIVCYRF